MTGHRLRRLLEAGAIRLVLLLVVIVAIAPIFWMVTTSFKDGRTALALPPKLLDFELTLDNYASLISGASSASGFTGPLVNSVIVALGATALAIMLGFPAAYVLARARFRHKPALAMWILSTTMFPPMVAVIPIFLIAGNLGVIDTYPVLIIPYAAFNLPLVIWMLRSVIRQIPVEIDEAAFVDGASPGFVLRRIIVPLAAPGIAATAMLSVFLSWNEFLFALTLTRSNVRTAPVAINEFTTMFGTQWGNLTAGATLVVAPILILALLMGRRLIQGLTFGAVK
jgi:ABC-type glycerol-3-phosphate transport system permease component